MSAHTPGPWRVDVGGCIRTTAEEAGMDYVNGRGLPQVALVTGLHEGRPDGEKEANERLIAAAPDLLDALKALHSQYVTVNGGAVMRKAARAIAKAEGR